MGERWEILIVIAIVLISSLASVGAHKTPVIEHTYVSHIWEEKYTTIPRQPVVRENILLRASVEHPGETIEGEVSAIFAVYRDDTRYEWFDGKSYKNPNWYVLKDVQGEPSGKENEFQTDIVVERGGSYWVFIDWYEDQQYIGQSMHMLDVEQRTIGPLYMIFSVLILLAVIIGVRRGVL